MNKFYTLCFALIIPLLLFSDIKKVNESTDIKLINKKINDNHEIITADNIQKELLLVEEDEVKKKIINQNKLLNKVIEELNSLKFDGKKLIETNKEKLIFLKSRVQVNKRYDNELAIKRDELQILYLTQENYFNNTIFKIIKGVKEYKDKKYFKKILENNIKSLEKNDLNKYYNLYLQERNKKNFVSSEFSKNYLKVYTQSDKYKFILNTLSNDMLLFRQGTFFSFLLEEFNFNYFIDKINNIPGISFANNLTSYYFNFKMGKLIFVLFLIASFRYINKYVVRFFLMIFRSIIVRFNLANELEAKKYLLRSIGKPLTYVLILLATQISIYILVENNNFIEKVMPWINTLYVAILTWIVYKISTNFINSYAHEIMEKYPHVRTEMIVFILRIFKVILALIVLLFLFTQLGVDIKAIAASLGVGGIAVALAAKDTLANLFGSLNIMADNSFSQGDWIKTPSVEGTVVDIRMRTTRIRTFDNAMITVPNSKLADIHIINWSKRKIGRRIKMSLGITYESKMSDIKNLKNDIFEMLLNHPGISTSESTKISKRKYFQAIKHEDLVGVKNTLLVYIDEFSSSSINILVYCFTKDPAWENWLRVKEDMIIKISELVEKNNCEFAYPTQTIIVDKKEDNILIDKN